MSADTQSPLPRRTVSVAIIGAGVAGLRAAEVLLNANNKGDTNVEYHVTVFEARNRIGGRVATSDGVEGWSGVGKAVDLGPNWIHGIHENPLVPLLSLTTPPSVSFNPYEFGVGWQHIPAPGGPKIPTKDAADGIFAQVMLAIGRAENYSRRLKKEVDVRWSLKDYLGVAAEVRYGVSVPRDPGAEHEGEEWEKEKVRVREFERKFMEEGDDGGKRKITGGSGSGSEGDGRDIDTTISSEEKARLFMQMAELWGAWVGEPVEKQGLRWLIMEEGMEGGQHFLASTYAPVLDLFSKPLFSAISEGKATLHLNTEVTHIDLAPHDESPPRITITTSPTSPTSTPSTIQTSTFSAALLCIPLGVLKHSHQTLFPPPPSPLSLPPRALSAINNLGYGRLEKVYLRFEHAWWPRDAVLIAFLEDGSTKTNPTDANTTSIASIPPQTQMAMVSLSSLPAPHTQPTLLFYLYGETAAALIRALDSLPSPHSYSASFPSSSSSSTSPATKTPAPHPTSPHFTLLSSFFGPYLTRLQHSLALTHPQSKSNPTPPLPPTPTQIIHTAHSASRFSGYGSYTQFPPNAQDSESDISVLQNLGGGRGGAVVASGWDNIPVWLAGEHVSPRKGLATVAGAWWSGGEKAGRVRAWFEEE